MDAHGVLQSKAGNATWLNEFSPVIEGPKKHIAAVLLWMLPTWDLCCVIVGVCAMYLAGKLESHPNLINIYMAHWAQKLSSDISVLLHLKHTCAFSFGIMDFYIIKNSPRLLIKYLLHYQVRCRNDSSQNFWAQSAKLCGPRSNIDLSKFVWDTFDYCCTNYSMILLPSHTSGSEIVYTLHIKAEQGGVGPRLCGNCVCYIE